jgi:hypothetical protein
MLCDLDSQMAWSMPGQRQLLGLVIGLVKTNLQVQPSMTGQRFSRCPSVTVAAIVRSRAGCGVVLGTTVNRPTRVTCIGHDSCHPGGIKDFSFTGQLRKAQSCWSAVEESKREVWCLVVAGLKHDSRRGRFGSHHLRRCLGRSETRNYA